LFAIGQTPTGDKDPFGLRRPRLGVVRILVEKKLALPLSDAIAAAFDAFGGVAGAKDAREALESFILERLRRYLREQGGSANRRSVDLTAAGGARVVARPARAVQAFEALPSRGARRRQQAHRQHSSQVGAEAAPRVDRARLDAGAEHDLYAAFESLGPKVSSSCDAATTPAR
jgi:glycyl-tRNA synthetase beta chain